MDFGTLLHTAKSNDTSKRNEIKYYSTKLAPPKKESKKSTTLSANIQKFLARKDAEEKKTASKAKEKRDELLALRSKDKKATRRVNVMLKRTKSANQSVIEDATDDNNTSVTLAGPSQPDEDDYGYVSQEASAFYNQMMEKYSKIPDEPKFPTAKKRVSNNLASTKDRVRAALEREQEEATMPHRRKRKRKEEEGGAKEEGADEVEDEPIKEEKPKAKPRNNAPPPMHFNDLLKLAATKQHEPILIPVKPKEEGPLLTKKQKLEQEKERQCREAKQNRMKEAMRKKEEEPRGNPIPKIDPAQPRIKNETKPVEEIKKAPPTSRPAESAKRPASSDLRQPKALPKPPEKQHLKPPKPKDRLPNRNVRGAAPEKPIKSNTQPSASKQNAERPQAVRVPSAPPSKEIRTRPPAKESKLKHTNSSYNAEKYFPVKPAKGVPKGRILDDDDSEYDSELDDFIDDGPIEGEDYSSCIREIFGYDKRKYMDDDDDVDNMESSFAQQMQEDVRSTKIGIMEDMEDMRLEKEEKRKKALMKKKKKM